MAFADAAGADFTYKGTFDVDDLIRNNCRKHAKDCEQSLVYANARARSRGSRALFRTQ